jgi:hypothetical protein
VLSAWAVAGIACLFTFLAFGRGSIVLMTAGAGAALVWKHTRSTWIPQAFAALVIAYLAAGLGGGAVGVRQTAVTASEIAFGAEKAHSLDFRFRHEAVLVERGWESPIYGVGGWGRNRISREEALQRLGHIQLITDGMWVIIFSERGLMGLASVWGWMLLPGMVAVWSLKKLPMPPASQAVVLGLACWSFLYAFDNLLNAFWTPVQPLVAGGLTTFVLLAAQYRRSRPAVGNGEPRRPPRPRQAVAARPLVTSP